jgi:FKBP-type peptidyl-prolyl cis-trans isomerase
MKGILSKEEMQIMVNGFSDTLLKNIDETEGTTILQTWGPKLNELITKRAMKAIDDEKDKGKTFISKYLLSNPKAVVTPSGLIFSETIAGVGAQASPSSTVLVHYHGKLIDGTVFDSSVDRGEPIKFPLKNVIKGWQEGVAMMRAGGKATLICPSDVAYGDNGSPPVIPPGATLIFDVELIQVL